MLSIVCCIKQVSYMLAVSALFKYFHPYINLF